MAKLHFERVTRDVEFTSFDCGVESINDYVKNSYYPTILQHAYTYCILYNDYIIGYYQVYFREIELEDLPDSISEYDCGIENIRISAVHIRFIAIDKKYQKNKIGTSVLRVIIKDIRELAEMWPVRLITIDARLDLMNWYCKEGFLPMHNNTVGQDDVTQWMYMDCMRFSRELDEYLDSF